MCRSNLTNANEQRSNLFYASVFRRVPWKKTDGSKITREVMTLEYLALYRHVAQSIPLFRPAVPNGHNIPQQSARMLPFACGSPTTSDHIQSSLLFLFRPLSEIHTPAPIPTYAFINTYSQWSTPRLSSTRLSLSSRVSLRTDPSSLLRRTSSLSVPTLPHHSPQEEFKLTYLYQFYAHFKQANEGDVSGPAPGMFDFVGKAKYNAWKKISGMSKEDAMAKYVELLTEVCR